LDALLSLQEPLSRNRAHDETLFIIIHQTYELWFKEILHELDSLRTSLETDDLPRAQLTLKRIIAIVKVMTAQLDVLETMLPHDFLAFRDFLGTASGFQSVQFREMEFVCGLKRREILRLFPKDSEAGRRLEERYFNSTIWDAFLHFLAHKRHPVPEDALHRDPSEPIAPSLEVQKVLLDVYSGDPTIVFLCEMLLDFDEGFQQWRFRHVKMVQRMIGSKYGTGGSSGVEYLAGTLLKPFFPDLWAVRTEFQKA
jgi:tryptophan 2,3-dioxygenase